MNEPFIMNLPFKIDLGGKVCVITGAGGVLCSMFAKALAQCGAKVALLDLNLEAAEKFAHEITQCGGFARAYKVNVLEKSELIAVHDQVVSDMGRCDILINGAGGNSPKATTGSEYLTDSEVTDFFDLDKDSVEFVFDLNFIGTLLPTQVFAADMVLGGGNIINISSMCAFTPLTKVVAYSGAKAAVSNLTQWLAVHFSNKNIRVNAIAPGFFVTKQNEKLLFNDDNTPTDRTAKILAATPMGRFGKEEELVGALLFLASSAASSFITGVVIPIDGGFSAYSGV